MISMLMTSETRGKTVSLTFFLMLLLPTIATGLPASELGSEDERHWWLDTSMDSDGDFIHDAIWIAAQNNHHQYLDEDGLISVIVDFDHTPTEEDQAMLEREVEFQTQFRYWLIDSIAGTVELSRILAFIVVHDIDVVSQEWAGIHKGIVNSS